MTSASCRPSYTSRTSRAIRGLTLVTPVAVSLMFLGMGIALVVQGHPPGVLYFGVGLILAGSGFGAWLVREWRRYRRLEAHMSELLMTDTETLRGTDARRV
jgi:hypothetical protein